MKKLNQQGMAALEVIIILIVVLAVAGVGYYVWNAKKSTEKTLDNTASSQGEPQKTSKKITDSKTNTPTSSKKYLEIKELGIKLELTDANQDAYYYASSSTNSGKPSASLSTHSLDSYDGCTAASNKPGIAIISSFVDGQADDPVIGNYKASFPKAQKIGGVYYYIIGNQYDCTLGKATSTYENARKAFVDSYSTIQAL